MNDDNSLGDEATFAGAARRSTAEMSLGDERTFGDRLDDQETIIDDIEVVDLKARYKPEASLGRGGMGEVLLALDTRLGRKVAIKRILGDAARSKTAVSRFLTEAKAIAAINHPNVVQIFDYGRAKDGPFLIMEYVDGSSLLDRCRDGALPLEQAIDLACQLCDGLAKAHDLGIVHRDIKPANVLLTKDGLPKLTDFGLAKAETADHQMTMTGAVLGTPDFMPPEQRRDAALVDARSDLWSLAATLYQMVTGRSPKIIRFNDVPAVLQDVLAKALEEGKDDRYQSARELRDALKASLVTAAPAPADLGEGQCPSCGVKNDSSRRFCRGCGESLEAPCLSCAKPMPMWEAICGQCGTKQPPLIEERRGEMAARQAEADSLLKDHAFERAEQIAVALRDENDPRFKHLSPWATTFLQKITTARDSQLAKANASLSEALKHEASFDYPSAIHALEQVPEALRERALDGQAESVATALGRVSGKQSEVERLELLVKAKLAAKELGGLLPDAERLQALRPDRADVRKLCTQLTDRTQKLEAQRDDAIRLAETHLASKEYESALAVLRKVDRSVETSEVLRLRDASDGNIKALQALMREIGNAVSQKQLDGLISKVQAALALKPGHAELGKLLESLESRETKVAAGVQDVVSQASEAFTACRFDKAVAVLQRIPESRRNGEVADLLDRSEYLAMTKAGVIKGFEGLPKVSDLSEVAGIDLSGLAIQGRSYLGQIATHGLGDSAIEQWCIKCEAAAEKREAAEEAERLAKANLRRIFVGAGLGVAALVLVAAGFAVRSSWRSATVKAALMRGDWQAVLSRDPDNVAALIGLAKSKLASQPPDIDGAFADLDQVARIAPGSNELKMNRAATYVARAVGYAAVSRLDEASKDLSEASKLTIEENILQPAREALASAWADRCTKLAAQDKLEDAGAALTQLRRYTDEPAVSKAAEEAMCDARVRRVEKLIGTGHLLEAERQLEEAQRLLPARDTSKATALLIKGWVRQGEAAIAKGDFQMGLDACMGARKHGAEEHILRPLLAAALLGQAATLQTEGNSELAVSKFQEAFAYDELAVTKTILTPRSEPLRSVVISSLCAQFHEAWTRGNWAVALDIAKRTAVLGADSTSLITDAISKHPRGLAEVPASVLAGLPRSVFPRLPVAVFQTIPNDLILTLPADLVPLLPPSFLASLPDATTKRLPPFRNSLGMQFKLLPHKPLLIGVTEVTNEQWTRIMGATQSRWREKERPVEQISWEDAVRFCEKLSQQPEEVEYSRIYRLPTESEWEYACRAGTKTTYSFGDDASALSKHAWFLGNSAEKTHPVGEKQPNAFGLYDMHGNVWEWCADSIAGKVPQERAYRGGGWNCIEGGCASSFRGSYPPAEGHDALGFRIVCEVAQPKTPAVRR